MEFLREIRFAARYLRQRPLLTLVATVSIALGIGFSTTIYSVANALLLSPPAGISEPDRVVELGRTSGGRGFNSLAWPDLVAMREGVAQLDGVSGWRLVTMSYSNGQDAEEVIGAMVTSDYFRIMGLTPAAGRFFVPGEDVAPGDAPLAVLGHGFWTDRMGGDPAVIGRTIDLNRHSFTIVGVMPAGFRSHEMGVGPDLFIPMTQMAVARPGQSSDFDSHRSNWFQMVARLSDGTTLPQAQAALDALYANLPWQETNPDRQRGVRLSSLSSVPTIIRGPVTMFVGVLGSLVLLILLTTCSNVAGMLLARATSREREIAVRLAIGASRARLARQLIVESLLVFAIGGAGGVLLAVWATGLLSAWQAPFPLPVAFDFRPDLGVIALGFALALATGIFFGLAPALQSTNPDLVRSLRRESGSAPERRRLRQMFISVQIAVSVVMLVAGGLFARSLQRAATTDPGFSQEQVYYSLFDSSINGYDSTDGPAFVARLLEAVAAAPGVTNVAVGLDMPLDLSTNDRPTYPVDWVGPNGSTSLQSGFNIVSEDYFATLSIPLEQGRIFERTDRSGGPVVVVSSEYARRAWPGADPLGRLVRVEGDESEPATVVGVVGDVKNQFLMEDIQPMVYMTTWRTWDPRMALIVRSNLPSDQATQTIRAAMRDADPRLSHSGVRSLASLTALGTLPQRIAASLAGALGLLAVALAAMGIYGVVAHSVAQRTREIGVRMALGADRARVMRLVIGGTFRMALPGVMAGGLLAAGIAVLIRGFILGVSPADPVVLGGAALAMLGVLALAAWFPARQAAGIEPVRALGAD